MTEAVIVEAVRSPFGKRGGSLAGIHSVDVLATVLQALVERSGVDPGEIQDNIAGCVSQVGEQSINVARNAWLGAGVPEEGPRAPLDPPGGASPHGNPLPAPGGV